MKHEIGHAVKIQEVLGHITNIEGGVYTMTTPHGTVIKAGFVWLRTLTTEEQESLQNYVIDANALKDQYSSML